MLEAQASKKELSEEEMKSASGGVYTYSGDCDFWNRKNYRVVYPNNGWYKACLKRYEKICKLKTK